MHRQGARAVSRRRCRIWRRGWMHCLCLPERSWVKRRPGLHSASSSSGRNPGGRKPGGRMPGWCWGAVWSCRPAPAARPASLRPSPRPGPGHWPWRSVAIATDRQTVGPDQPGPTGRWGHPGQRRRGGDLPYCSCRLALYRAAACAETPMRLLHCSAGRCTLIHQFEGGMTACNAHLVDRIIP